MLYAGAAAAFGEVGANESSETINAKTIARF
jgi:hypothetical protein